MSLRVDTASLISGAIVCGNRGLGVVGSLIPASGDHGPGYTYNDLSLPADNGKEICGRITTWPTSGTLTAYEDTSFEYTGTSDTFQYQLYVDGVSVGSPTTVTLQVGAAVGQLNAISDAAVFSGAASISLASPEARIAAQTDDVSSNSAAKSPPVCSLHSIVADVVFAGSAESIVTSTCAIVSTGEDCSFSGQATSNVTAFTISATVGDASFSGAGLSVPTSRLVAACDNCVFSGRSSSFQGSGIVFSAKSTITQTVQLDRSDLTMVLNFNSFIQNGGE